MSQPGKSEVQLTTDTGTPTGAPGTESGTPAAGGETQVGQFGGFNSVEELVAAHEALKNSQVAPKTDETKGGPPKIDDGDAVSDALKTAGLNQDTFTQEFAESGTLSEDSFKSLESKGFSREMVNVYLEGLRAQQSAYNAAVFAPAGGEAQYGELLKWAGTNLNAEEKRAFNEAVGSGDAARAALAVQGLSARRGTPGGKLINGKTASNADAGPKPFKSLTEVSEAKRDPRYRRDPAFRQEVSERLRVSNVLQ